MEGQMTIQMKKKRVYYRTCDKCKNKVENYNGKIRFRVTTKVYPKPKNSHLQSTIMWTKKVWLCNNCIKIIDSKKEVGK